MFLQQGGFKGRFNPFEVNQRIVRDAPSGYLPIPSQKRSICVSDSLLVAILYSDFLRDKIWGDSWSGASGIIEPDTLPIERKLSQYSSKTSRNNSEKLEIAKFYVAHGVIRVGHLIYNTIPSTKRAKSFEEEQKQTAENTSRPPLPAGYKLVVPRVNAEGEKCAMWLQVFSGKSVNKRNYSLYDWQANISQNLLNTIIKMPLFEGKFLTTQNIHEGAGRYLCAILVNVSSKDAAHKICLSKIDNRWYYCNNEIGFAVPINKDTKKFEDGLLIGQTRFSVLTEISSNAGNNDTLKWSTNDYNTESLTEPRELINQSTSSSGKYVMKEIGDSRRVYIFGPPLSSITVPESSSQYPIAAGTQERIFPKRSLATGVEGITSSSSTSVPESSSQHEQASAARLESMLQRSLTTGVEGLRGGRKMKNKRSRKQKTRRRNTRKAH